MSVRVVAVNRRARRPGRRDRTRFIVLGNDYEEGKMGKLDLSSITGLEANQLWRGDYPNDRRCFERSYKIDGIPKGIRQLGGSKRKRSEGRRQLLYQSPGELYTSCVFRSGSSRT